MLKIPLIRPTWVLSLSVRRCVPSSLAKSMALAWCRACSAPPFWEGKERERDGRVSLGTWLPCSPPAHSRFSVKKHGSAPRAIVRVCVRVIPSDVRAGEGGGEMRTCAGHRRRQRDTALARTAGHSAAHGSGTGGRSERQRSCTESLAVVGRSVVYEGPLVPVEHQPLQSSYKMVKDGGGRGL